MAIQPETLGIEENTMVAEFLAESPELKCQRSIQFATYHYLLKIMKRGEILNEKKRKLKANLQLNGNHSHVR